MITVPTIINNIQNRQNIAKLKKAYSVLSNTVNYIKLSGISLCNIDTPDTQKICNGGSNAPVEFKDELVRLLEPLDVCGCDYGNRCGKAYPWAGLYNGCYSGGGGTIYKDFNGNPVGSRNIDRRVLLLKDGTVVYFGYLDFPGLSITVDVNGTKGPNVLSKDLFLFIVTPKGLSPYGSPDTDYRSDYTGYKCDGDYSKVKDAVTIYMAAGAGCAAKYLIE